MTEATRFHAENLYYDLATGEEDKACSVAREWVQTFPQTSLPTLTLPFAWNI